MQFKRILSLDFETYSEADLKKCGQYVYTRHKSFEILMCSYHWHDEKKTGIVDVYNDGWPDWLVEAIFDPEIQKRAYNAPFEIAAIEGEFGIEVDTAQWDCTMVRAARAGWPISLDRVSKAMGLIDKKDPRGQQLINFWCKPCAPKKSNGMRTRNLPSHEPTKWKEFLDYCIQDTIVECAVGKKVEHIPVTEFEQELWRFDQRVNSRGVHIDRQFVTNAIEIDRANKHNLKMEAMEFTGLQNPNSRDQLKQWLADNGSEVEDLKKGTVKDLMMQLEDGLVMDVLALRLEMNKTSVSKYSAIFNRASLSDDRCRGVFQFYGALRTGRWAGRGFQPQNLPRNYLKTNDMDRARNYVLVNRALMFGMIYGNIPDTLSQLIRASFTAKPGYILGISDFAAIEARVLAWMAGETWRLKIFATHGKIYEASASVMFNIPIGTIVEGHPNYMYRDLGKVAELALGFGGALGAMETMGAARYGLSEHEMIRIVKLWRKANPKIVKLWYDTQEACMNAIRNPGEKFALMKGAKVFMNGDSMYIKLPSGRMLAYVGAHIIPGDRGPQICYWETNSKGQFAKARTYGGKIIENCLAGDTLVLTKQSGWIKITRVRKWHKLWDGDNWVSHQGLLGKGAQKTIRVDGVGITKDHLILTNEGWKAAEQSEGYYRSSHKLHNSPQIFPFEWSRRLGYALRLRKRVQNGYPRIQQREAKIVRMYALQVNRRKQYETRSVQTPYVPRLEINESSMLKPKMPCVRQLRRSRNKSLLSMAKVFSEFLGRYARRVPKRLNLGTGGRKLELLEAELYLGYNEKTSSKQTNQHFCRIEVGQNNRSRSFRAIRNKRNNAPLPTSPQLDSRKFVHNPGFFEPVYDLVNAGENHRFTIKSPNGSPFIVHNCTQSIARDCLAVAMIRVEEHGYNTVLHIHDEMVNELNRKTADADLKKIDKIMGLPIDWAPGLVLTAKSFKTEYYKKD